MNTKSEQSHSEWLKNVKHVFVSFIAKRIAMERYTVHCWLCAHCTNLHWISYTSCVLIRTLLTVCTLHKSSLNKLHFLCSDTYTADCVHTAQIFTEQAALLVFWYVHCWLCAHCTNLHWISYTSCVLMRLMPTHPLMPLKNLAWFAHFFVNFCLCYIHSHYI